MEEPLEKALQAIGNHGLQMRRCLETEGRLLAAIKHASLMLAELRTGVLGPKQYYELYVAVFDYLSQLGDYLREDHRNHHLADIYEIVQYVGGILPRLYLMVTVGSAYLATADAPTKSILKDMLEMCRGVQHPLRGLFLRYYLGQRTRDNLPTVTDSSKGREGGTLSDSIRFTTTNFIEMNKLWVRLQHQGHSSERPKRIVERKELQIIVGSNLVRLSQLDGVTLPIFRNKIFPTIVEQITQSRDVLAQEYLLDVIVQAFPADFHLGTLDLYLDTLAQLNPQVSIRKILMVSIDRLSQHVDGLDLPNSVKLLSVDEGEKLRQDANTTPVDQQYDGTHENTDIEDATNSTGPVNPSADGGEANEQGGDRKHTKTKEGPDDEISPKSSEDALEDTRKRLSQLVPTYLAAIESVRSSLTIADRAAIVESLARLAYLLDSDDLGRIHELLLLVEDDKSDLGDQQVGKLLLSLLSYLPLLDTIGFGTFQRLLAAQTRESQQAIASKVLEVVLSRATSIDNTPMAKQIFDLFSLITKGDSISEMPLAELVYLLKGRDINISTELLQLAHRSLREGGIRVVQQTYGAVVNASYRIIRDHPDKDPGPLLKFIGRTINDIASVGNQPEKAYRLYVSAALIADQSKAEGMAYEFFVQAFTLYEEKISDSRAQFQSICILTSTLQKTRGFSTDNYETLASRIALYGQKLLKKPDQCRAIYLASHLWMATDLPGRAEDASANLYHSSDRVLETLQRALRVADASMDVAVSVELFVEVLNRYLYFLERESPHVLPEHVSSLIDLIRQNLAKHADETTSDSPRKYFERTLSFIRSQASEGAPRFAEIELGEELSEVAK